MTATILMAAMTLAVGLVTVVWVNSTSAVIENALGQSYGATNAFLSERFVVINMNFSQASCNPNCVSLWIYNNGQIPFQVKLLTLYNSTKAMNVIYYNTAAGIPSSCTSVPSSSSLQTPSLASFTIPAGAVKKLTLSLPDNVGGHGCTKSLLFKSGQTFFVNIVGQYGNVLTYYQTM